MATSGSTDFNQTRNEVIQDAYSLIGIGVEGETLSNEETSFANRVLDRMVKTWETKGLHLWALTEGTLSLTASTASFTMGTGGDFATARPLRILSMRRYQNSIDTPMMELSRQEYFDLPEKTSEGAPTNWYYDPNLGHSGDATGTLYIWPTLASGSTASVKFTYERSLEDLDAAGNNFDFPTEWLEALTFNLAQRLMSKYPPQDGATAGRIDAFALSTLNDLLGWDRETAPILFGPDMEGY